jgi:hypothetical protein
MDCPRCGMPDIRSDVVAVMGLYGRCKTNGCLPFPGALVEQPECIMDLFEEIEAAKARAARKKRVDMEFSLEHRRFKEYGRHNG